MNTKSISTGKAVMSLVVIITMLCATAPVMFRFISRFCDALGGVFAIMVAVSAMIVLMSICLIVSLVIYLATDSDSLAKKINAFGILLFDSYFALGFILLAYGSLFSESYLVIAVSVIGSLLLLGISAWNMHDRNRALVKSVIRSNR